MATDLRRSGIEPSRGGWHHVRHGVWMRDAEWASLTSTQRHAAFVYACALQRRQQKSFIAAGSSAAAVWGLPRIEPWPRQVRYLAHVGRNGGSSTVRPVVGRETEPEEIHGLLLTPVARTLVDLARSESLATSVAAADHALRHGLSTQEELRAEVSAIPARSPGRTKAKLTADLADPMSMSAGESLSRVQMFLLNLPKPILQHELHDDHGLIGLADFWWEGVAGEFDGQAKYRIPSHASPDQASRILWKEKQREDRIRAGAKVVRWVWADALDQVRLLAVLSRAGIRPVPRNRWFDVGGVAGS